MQQFSKFVGMDAHKVTIAVSAVDANEVKFAMLGGCRGQC